MCACVRERACVAGCMNMGACVPVYEKEIVFHSQPHV